MDGTPPDGNVWVTYSMNKEDIWVSKIPVPITEKVSSPVNDIFANMKDGEELKWWNIFSPLWCQVNIERHNNQKVLALHDSDPFDYAKAERVFPSSKRAVIEFSVIPQQNAYGLLEVELVDEKGTPCIRFSFDSTGEFITKAGYRNRSLSKYNAGEPLVVKVQLNTATRFYTCTINGKNPSNNLCFAPVESVERIVFRTGSTRRFPNAETPTDQDYDLPNPDRKDKEAVYYINYLKTSAIK
jgi:hypothetical protein